MTTPSVKSEQLSNIGEQSFKSNLLSQLFTFEDKPILVLGTPEEPLFIDKQICDILEFTNSRKALKDNVDQKWKLKFGTLSTE